MHHGTKTNTEIETLLQIGVKVDDTVYSKDWNITLKFDGFVFKSVCSCEFIGTMPYCGDNGKNNNKYNININLNNTCESVIDAYGSFVAP